MSLMKLNILEDSMDIVRGHQMIMQYGNGDFFAAFDKVVRELDALVPNDVVSEEGFIEWVKDAGTYVWTKIKELWNMLVAFVKRIFGKNTLENTPSIRNVINYGPFPEGYIPSDFENVNSTIGDGYFMPSVRSMQQYLERVSAICNLFKGELTTEMTKVINDYDVIDDNEEYPMTRFKYFVDNHNPELRDLCGLDINTGRITKLFNKGDDVYYSKYIGKLYTPIQPASLYARVNPYLEGGWTSGVFFKNMIGRDGLLNRVKQEVSDTITSFNDKVVDRYNAKQNRVGRGIAFGTPSSKTRYALWDDHIQTINSIVCMILNRFIREITELENLMKINCDAINADITKKFQK